MIRRTTLLTLAATLAPLPLYAGDCFDIAADEFATLAAPAALPGISLQERAAALPAAAVLPADVELALVLPHPADRLMESDPETAMFIAPLDGVALGLAKDTDKSLAALQCFVSLVRMQEITGAVAAAWQAEAKDALAGLISTSGSDFGAQMYQGGEEELSKVVLHPVYLVLSAKPEAKDALNILLTMCLSSLNAETIDGAENVTINGYSGLKISGAALSAALQEQAGDGEPDMAQALMQAELAKRTFYLLAGMHGNSAVVVLCENPEEIHLADTAEQSVLSTAAWSAADAHLTDKPLALLSVSPELAGVSNGSGKPAAALLEKLSELFSAMTGKDNEETATFQTAAKGFATLSGMVGDLVPNTTQATFLQVWNSPGHAYVEITQDANGFSYKPASLRQVIRANTERNILYVESTPMEKQIKADAGMVQAIKDAAAGSLATLKEEKQGEISAAMQMLESYLPELQQAGTALTAIGEGLGNTAAIILDAAGEVPAEAAEAGCTAIPRFALYCGVADRSKLAQGWEALLEAAASAATKSGLPSDMLDSVKFSATTEGATTSYNLELPEHPDDAGFNVTVSDTDLAIGSSATLNARIMLDAVSTGEFAGTVFSLNFQELAKTARAFTDAIPAPEVEDDEEDEESVAADCKAWAELVAGTLERIAEVADNLKGASTIKDGTRTTRIDIKLKK